MAEFKAFKAYLEVIKPFADKVPGMGEMYGKYVKAVDRMTGGLQTGADFHARTVENVLHHQGESAK